MNWILSNTKILSFKKDNYTCGKVGSYRKFTEGEENDRVPFIRIGIDKINEPLKVQTMDGVVFKSISDKINN